MTSQPTLVLTGATILTPNGWLENATLVIERGRIVDIHSDLPASFLFSQDDVTIVSLAPNTVLTPGLIDLQINGAYGVDFSQTTIPGIQQVLAQLPRHGVTGILPTLVTGPAMDMVSAVNTLEETLHIARQQQTRLLGIHLEGPVLNPAKCGAHPVDQMVPCDSEDLPLLLSPHVKVMTMAPEMDPDGQLTDALCKRGIIPFAGHTTANLPQLQQAVDRGVQAVTHLYNAMDGFNHRTVGTALHALNHPGLKATIIADGEHVHPEMVRLAKTIKGTDKLMVVSDAMPLAGLPDGNQCQFAGQTTFSRNGKALNPQGTLAGSVQLLDSAVRNLVNWQVATLEEAITMASTNPADLLGLGHELGRLAPGYRADFVLWNKDSLEVMATWLDGQLRWASPASAGSFLGSTTTATPDGLADLDVHPPAVALAACV
jgi:N-acetylglucosamine-6-phosphate deacetylase